MAFSFIEPNYMDSVVHGPENGMHPESHTFQLFGHSNVEQGEKLVYQVYSAIRERPYWDKILLLILFDEHGGCYDHVCPPTAKECPFAISPDGVVIPPDQSGARSTACGETSDKSPLRKAARGNSQSKWSPSGESKLPRRRDRPSHKVKWREGASRVTI